ncbi:hypothetical protein M514_02462 [Trichuris suis]|uniref:Uncharacterized protein n=1 Tax=Trichuris suis TaxID=68888 RepID=A0A085NF81_9BILA|nr:hypothetical protein M513_02462 [Trichuris suis]KFD68127.1 hypothetical protein M514_02462 [Trichuris suis]
MNPNQAPEWIAGPAWFGKQLVQVAGRRPYEGLIMAEKSFKHSLSY